MSGTRRVTVHDVAALAHVSAQTVSRVVNGAPGVAPATRALVQRAVDELGFVPDPAARSLRTGRSRRIGVLVHQLTATGPTGNTAGALAELRVAGYELDVVLLPDLDDDDPGLAAAVSTAMAGFARTACAVMAMAQTEAVRAAVLTAGAGTGAGPPVYVDEHLDRGTEAVPGAEELACRAAAEHLFSLGHRSVAHLPGPAGSLSAVHRAASFEAACRRAATACATWSAGDWSAASGYAVTSDVLARSADLDGVTAVFAANDAMAVGVLRALAEHGVEVPGRVAVVGVDDLPESAFTTPALTSVRHDTVAEGRLAARVLLADLTGTARPDPADHLVVALVARASTAATRPQGTRDR